MAGYDAFMSYSHAADNVLAPRLQSALHRFAKPWWQMRAVRVFRDTTNLAVSPALWNSIVRSLDASEYFLLMASEGAARSEWVAREVEHWLVSKPHDRLIIVLTEGEMEWSDAAQDFDWSITTALPRAMEGVFRQEPLYVDMRWARRDRDLTLQNPRFASAVAQISSTLRGRDLDDLIGEDVVQHRRTRRVARAAVTALAVLAIVSAGAAVVALQQRREADAQRQAAELAGEQERQSRIAAEARLLAANATQALHEEDGLIVRAALLAVASLKLAYTDRAAEVARVVLARLAQPVGIAGEIGEGNPLAPLQDNVRIDRMNGDPDNLFATGFGSWSAHLRIMDQDAGEISSQSPWQPLACQDQPDWMTIATAPSNSALRVTDTRSNRFHVVTHEGRIVACKVLDEGDRLVTASGDVQRELPPVPIPGDQTLVVWDIADSLYSYGAEFDGSETVIATDFSADGHLAALSTLDAPEIPVFDMKTGRKTVGLTSAHPATGLAFDASGKRLAAAPTYEQQFDLFEGDDFQTHAILDGSDGEGDVRFSPDGAYLVTDYGALSGGGADIWRTDDPGQPIRSFPSTSNVDILFLSDSQRFIEIGENGVRLWHIGGAEPDLVFGDAHADSAIMSPDDSWLALGEYGKGVTLWSVQDGRLLQQVELWEWPELKAISPDSALLVVSEDGRLQVLNIADGKVPAPVPFARDYGETIGAAAFSASGQYLAVSTYGYGGQEVTGLDASTVLDIFETEGWTRVARLNPRGLVRALEFSADETWLRSQTYLSEESGAAPAFIWLWQRDALTNAVCARMPRRLTSAEWAEYFPDRAYEPVCGS